MLKINKSISLTGVITIKEKDFDKQVVYLSANISPEGGNDNINQTIQDKDLYSSNKEEIRKDVDAFIQQVYTIQDDDITNL